MYPTCYSRIPQCNAVVFFRRRRRSWITAETNIFNDGVSGFRLEMSTIYLVFNIEYLTFKINLKKTWTRKCNIQHNLQLSSWVPGLFTWCGRICLRHTNTRRIYWRKWRLEMFIVVSEFSFVRSLNSALYHEHYIGNSEWVNRERFRTQLMYKLIPWHEHFKLTCCLLLHS